MRPQVGRIVHTDAKRVLQQSATCEYRYVEGGHHWNRSRHVSPAAAHHERTAINDTSDRIVASRHDFAVVHEEQIRHAG